MTERAYSQQTSYKYPIIHENALQNKKYRPQKIKLRPSKITTFGHGLATKVWLANDGLLLIRGHRSLLAEL